MSKKIYKGYELIKAIADGEIYYGTKFKMNTVWNGSFFIKNIDVITKYKDIVYTTGEKIPAWAIINGNFELIEDGPIDIDNIEELLEIEEYEVDKTDTVINRNKINELVQAAKQLNKEIKELKEKN